MKRVKIILLSLGLAILLLLFVNSSLIYEPVPAQSSDFYQYQPLHSRDGLGKFYQGREIAKVMGHQEFLWLERPSREKEEQPSAVIEALNLQPTDLVADLGAGSGYFSFRIAEKIPLGLVFAVDIQPEMLDIINFFEERESQLTGYTCLR